MRALSIWGLALCLMVLTVLPAQAQKDPFQPLVVPEEEQGATLTPGVQGQIAPEAPAPAPEPSGPQLPRAGSDADMWFPAAVLLILLGVAILSFARYRELT